MADKNRAWMRQKDVDDLGQDAGWCSVYSYEPAPPSHAATLVIHEEKHEPVYTQSEVEQLVKTLRMAFNVVDELNAEGFGPLTSKEGLDAFSALVDALDVFDPA
jgi:hypothetical protein